jgi:ADP-heptose:LPS heptosyltransferase
MVIFHVEGGLGKHIMSTAILKVIAKQHPESKINVVCSYPEVFKHNPLVNSVTTNGEHGPFYKTHIKDKENKIKLYYSDPYTHSDYILEQDHLYNIWAKQWGLTYDGETPQIYLTQSEIDYFKPFYKLDKPILAIQPNGGPASLGYNYSWTRDIPEPIVNSIIEEFKNEYSIVHIKREDQKVYPNTLHALDNFRSIAILLQLSNKRLLIDSFTQHLAASFKLPSTVCWVTTKPTCFGYEMHDNILANKFTLPIDFPNNLYQPFNLSQDITSCPYNNLNEVFDIDKIINSIRKQW